MWLAVNICWGGVFHWPKVAERLAFGLPPSEFEAWRDMVKAGEAGELLVFGWVELLLDEEGRDGVCGN